MKFAALWLAALALAGCSTTPGTGWSRASDLSVYSSMGAYARVAWEQDVLCEGWAPARATASWEREFGWRHAAVREALIARHGAAALERAGMAYAVPVACTEVSDHRWRLRYARMLRLLEIRLGLT